MLINAKTFQPQPDQVFFQIKHMVILTVCVQKSALSLESSSWNLLKVPAEERLMYSNAWFDWINVLSISDVWVRPVVASKALSAAI